MSDLLKKLIEAGTPGNLVAEVALVIARAELVQESLNSRQDRQSARTREYRKRRAISGNEWAALTRMVVDRDGWVCSYCDCDTSLDENGYSIDHILALTRGGNNDIDNLAMSCRACNSSKRDLLLGDEWTPPNDRGPVWIEVLP